MKNEDTVCAVSTPWGKSATGCIRVSGREAFRIVNEIFDGDVFTMKTSSVCHGYISDGNSIVDDVVITVFKSPKSYTGEDTVEISTHGSEFILRRVIALLIAHGARQATNGEFTKRAFLNGKLDLTQAEAIIDLIDADSVAAADMAINRLKGGISDKVNWVYDKLMGVVAQLFAVIDYPDEDIDDVTSEELFSAMEESYNRIKALTDTYSQGSLIRNGIRAVITGKPNAGKSTLMNSLLGYERSIVDNTAGTTRDYIEETTSVNGVKLILCDTAGIREAEGRIESVGIKRAKEKTAASDIIIAIFDASTGLDDDDRTLISDLATYSVPKICVWNKSDLGRPSEEISGFDITLSVCAKTGEGTEKVKESIASLFPQTHNISDGVICDMREYECLIRAQNALSTALTDRNAPADMLLCDAEEALEALGETTGKTVTEQITENIFSRFCVGK